MSTHTHTHIDLPEVPRRIAEICGDCQFPLSNINISLSLSLYICIYIYTYIYYTYIIHMYYYYEYIYIYIYVDQPILWRFVETTNPHRVYCPRT